MRAANALDLLLLLLLSWSTGPALAQSHFVRGDSNGDREVDLSDGVFTLIHLFLADTGLNSKCHDAADANDSGDIGLSDAVFTFQFLFLNGPVFPTPFPDCGLDAGEDMLPCDEYAPCGDIGPPAGQNVLLIIADDLGVDSTRCYSTDAVAPMPNIESLCSNGVVFRNVWSAPLCSPTRATILTGRYGFRTGVDGVGGFGLSLDETTIPKVLDDAESGYAHACLGKWHLGSNRNGGVDHPTLAGFDHFAGSLSGGLDDYQSWTKVVNGETTVSQTYATTETIDDAIAWIAEQSTPWLCWVALNAPHAPFHLPPSDLHGYTLTGTTADIDANPRDYFNATVEAMDTEIGRLLDSLPASVGENTNVIFLGDNGTPGRIVLPPLTRQRAKGSLYQGGVHVPLVIAGPMVEDGGRDVDAPVNTTDLFATILELAGVDVASSLPAGLRVDSSSLVPYLAIPQAGPQREFAVAELFGNMTNEDRRGRAIRDNRYKLIRFDLGSEELFDLAVDPHEATNLLASPLTPDVQSRFETLEAHLDALLATEN